MNPRLAKDFRVLAPPGGIALAAVLVPGLTSRLDAMDFMLALFAIGCTLMGVMILGQDVRQGTLALLLTQPLPRGRLWREKMQVLAWSLAVATAAWLLGVFWFDERQFSRAELWYTTGFIVLVTFCTAPFWTLLYRSILLGLLL